jgi:hypothetical protein
MLASKLVSDIRNRLYGGAPSDDSQLSKKQVLHWLVTSRDAIVKAKLDQDILAGKQIDSYYIERETGKAVLQEDLTYVDDDEDMVYFTLIKVPLTLAKDRGLVKVLTDEGTTVLRARLEQLEMIRDMKYSKPSSTNLVYYRHGQTVAVLGLNENLTTTEFTVYIVPSAKDVELSDELVITDDLVPILLDSVEEIARRELYGLSDTDNDGTQPVVPSEPVKRQI